MASVSIRIDAKGLLANLNSIVEKQQYRFALSLALNRTGADFQQAERSHFASVFTERRKSFLDREGAKRLSGPATKANPSVTYGISDRASFLTKFERGDTKLPTRGSALAIPVDIKRNKFDIVTTANRPKALFSRLGDKRGAGGVFQLTAQRGKLAPGIYQRTGRGGRSIKLLFAREPQAHTPAVLDFEQTFKRTVDQRLKPIFDQAMRDAIRTAK